MDAGTILAYLAQSAIFYAVGYLFYKIFMAKSKQPSINRMALLAIYIGSLIAPLYTTNHHDLERMPEETVFGKDDISKTVEDSDLNSPETQYDNSIKLSPKPELSAADAEYSDKGLETLPTLTAETHRTPIIGAASIRIIAAISLAGTLLAIFLLIFDLGKIFMLKHFGEERRLGHMKIFLVHSRNFSPFSFINWMFLSSVDGNESEDMIIAHEMGHIRHLHWLDLMIIRVCATLMWWNPLVWLLGRELRTVHEYQADADVLSRGHNISDYQMLLIRKAAAYNMSTMASHFAQSRLKRRFTMMRQTKAGKLATLRISALGAAFFAAILLIGTQTVQAAIDRLREISFDELITFNSETENTEEFLPYTMIATPDTVTIKYAMQNGSGSVSEDLFSSDRKDVGTDSNASSAQSDSMRTITIHDEDTGTTYTYHYRDGNLVSREVAQTNSSSSPHSSSISSSYSYSSSESEGDFEHISDIDSGVASSIIIEDGVDLSEYTDIISSDLQDVSALYQLNELSDLNELNQLQNLDIDLSGLQDLASNVHTYTADDGSEVIIINGKDTTFIWRETPVSQQQDIARQKAQHTKDRQKVLKEAAKQRAKANQQRQQALSQAQKERTKALKEAAQERAKANRQRQQALAEAKKAREKAIREAAQERQNAQKEYQRQIKEAHKQIKDAQKQIKEAQKQIAQSNKEVAAVNRWVENYTTIEGSVSRTSSGSTGGVTNFDNDRRRTSITIQLPDVNVLTVKSIRVRYDGKWHNIRQWNCSSNDYPSGSSTRIDITGPFSTKFHTDDIVEITTVEHGKMIYKIFG